LVDSINLIVILISKIILDENLTSIKYYKSC